MLLVFVGSRELGFAAFLIKNFYFIILESNYIYIYKKAIKLLIAFLFSERKILESLTGSTKGGFYDKIFYCRHQFILNISISFNLYNYQLPVCQSQHYYYICIWKNLLPMYKTLLLNTIQD